MFSKDPTEFLGAVLSKGDCDMLLYGIEWDLC
jgi:hypothetical protein